MWLTSMQYHPEFNWTLVTNLAPETLPSPGKLPNVNFVMSNLAEVNQSATDVLGYNAHITKAYKLCDFRPLFAKMFKHLITPDYTHWGYGDLDTVVAMR